MKKILIAILSILILTCSFGLIACGSEEQAPHTHDYSLLKYNETQHWYECSCEEKSGEENHFGGTATTTEKAKCSVCDIEYGELEKQPTEGLVFGLINDNTEYEVTTYTGDSTEVYISSTYNGKPVTSIGHAAFSNCKSITSVELPDSIKRINNSAFNYCQSLANIEIPDGVEFIGEYAFFWCTPLTKIEIPDSVEFICENAFFNCSNLQYNVEGNLKYLGNSNNPYLYLAGTTSNKVSSATINANCKIIGSRAFYECSLLTSVELPNSVISIGEVSFFFCTSLKSITIPNGVKYLGYSAFYNCNSLSSVKLSNSLEHIGEHAFYGCTSLTSIVIPESVQSIREGVFTYCTKLKTINCEINKKPSGWFEDWLSNCSAEVVWGYKG